MSTWGNGDLALSEVRRGLWLFHLTTHHAQACPLPKGAHTPPALPHVANGIGRQSPNAPGKLLTVLGETKVAGASESRGGGPC
jgi:hypothetical protein